MLFAAGVVDDRRRPTKRFIAGAILVAIWLVLRYGPAQPWRGFCMHAAFVWTAAGLLLEVEAMKEIAESSKL
jgi:hypothetical protein